jgi:hypothetical protein
MRRDIDEIGNNWTGGRTRVGKQRCFRAEQWLDGRCFRYRINNEWDDNRHERSRWRRLGQRRQRHGRRQQRAQSLGQQLHQHLAERINDGSDQPHRSLKQKTPPSRRGFS